MPSPTVAKSSTGAHGNSPLRDENSRYNQDHWNDQEKKSSAFHERNTLTCILPETFGPSNGDSAVKVSRPPHPREQTPRPTR
jgi:hypothetical protein